MKRIIFKLANPRNNKIHWPAATCAFIFAGQMGNVNGHSVTLNSDKDVSSTNVGTVKFGRKALTPIKQPCGHLECFGCPRDWKQAKVRRKSEAG